jgi:sensor domain CHASE-containing protein/anti-anti-sigma regulatory factor
MLEADYVAHTKSSEHPLLTRQLGQHPPLTHAGRPWYSGLRNRTLLQIAILLVGLIIVLTLPLRTFFLASFLTIEQQSMAVDLERVQHAFAAAQETLIKDLTAWSSWNETYDYIENPNQAFINAYISPAMFQSNNVAIMMFFQNSGQLVFSQYRASEQGQQPVPSELLATLAANPQFIRMTAITERHSGIVLIPNGALLVAATPILDSNGEGPIHGTAIFGRLLNATELARLISLTRLPFRIQRVDDPQWSAELATVLPELTPHKPVVRRLNEQSIVGYALFTDLLGQPAIIARIEQPRTIYAEGLRGGLYFTFALIAVALLFAGLAMVILERQILRRVSQLSVRMHEIAAGSDFPHARVTMAGRDEIADLATSINATLATLQRAEQERISSQQQQQQQQQVIKGQEATLASLATPLISFGTHVVILPLVGELDPARIEQMQQTLLQGVAAQRSRAVIIDVTGVPTMDASIAAGFVRTTQAVKLLGAQVLLTGLRPAAATTLADLEVDFSGIVTCATLYEGVNRALEHTI